MAQLVALMSGVVLGGVAEVVGSNLARDKIFTASIGSIDSLYPSVYIYLFLKFIFQHPLLDPVPQERYLVWCISLFLTLYILLIKISHK